MRFVLIFLILAVVILVLTILYLLREYIKIFEVYGNVYRKKENHDEETDHIDIDKN